MLSIVYTWYYIAVNTENDVNKYYTYGTIYYMPNVIVSNYSQRYFYETRRKTIKYISCNDGIKNNAIFYLYRYFDYKRRYVL